ncbi:unnamed protein product [Withania somnifera]
MNCVTPNEDEPKWLRRNFEEWEVGPKDHQRFQASYAILLKARLTALKRRERKDKRKAADSDKRMENSEKKSSAPKAST